MSVRSGLADPVRDSQRVFRAVLDATAHPGRIVALTEPIETPAPLEKASAAVCLALVDFETPLWLDSATRTVEVVEYLRFHCGCPIVAEAGGSRFGLIADPRRMPPLDAFEAGTDEYPDRSATVIIQVGTLGSGAGPRLTGPGIESDLRLEVNGLPESFWATFRKNHSLFPRGVDVILVAGSLVAALPRTTRVDG